MSLATLTTPTPTPPTTVPTESYLIRITRYNASEPAGSRIMSIPGETRFKVFHAAVATTIGWNNEPCTFWVIKNTKKSPLVAPCPTPVLAHSYGMVIPSKLDDHGKLNEWMSLETRCRFWICGTHSSRQLHTIDVIGIVAGNRPQTIYLWGGLGVVDKQQAWQWEDIAKYQQHTVNGAFVHNAEAPIKEEEKDDDKDAVVRRNRVTK